MSSTALFKNKSKRKGVLTGASFLLFLALLTLTTVLIINHALSSLPFLANPTVVEAPDVLDNSGMYVPEDFPLIAFGEQYATLSVPDADIEDAPIYFGDGDEMLEAGIGHFAGSRFPGQNGKIVYSAHVTTIFRYFEDLKPGAKFEVKTKYGDYVYEMEKSVIFDYEDYTPLLPNDGTETLFCYTCYPYDNGGQLRTDRLGIICKKISGKNWITGEE